ncbi:MAG: hypothetical protein VX529_08240 [Pseudomonadota bacterium]|nr:hypothetical protein [Pseudomonadota bacterium]
MRILFQLFLIAGLVCVQSAPTSAQSREERIAAFVAWGQDVNELSNEAVSLLDSSAADEVVYLRSNSQIDEVAAQQRLDDWFSARNARLEIIEARSAVLGAGPDLMLESQEPLAGAMRSSIEDLIPRVRDFVEAQYEASSQAIAGNEVDWPAVASAQYAVFQQIYVSQIRRNLSVRQTGNGDGPEGAWATALNANMASMIVVLEMMRVEWGADPSQFSVENPVERLQERRREVRGSVAEGRRAIRERARELERSQPSTHRGDHLVPLIEQSSEILREALALEEEMSAALLDVGRRIEQEGVTEATLAQIDALSILEQRRADYQQRNTAIAQQMFPSQR